MQGTRQAYTVSSPSSVLFHVTAYNAENALKVAVLVAIASPDFSARDLAGHWQAIDMETGHRHIMQGADIVHSLSAMRLC